MVLIERVCYNIGIALADVVYFTAVPTGTAVVGRIAASSKLVEQFATKHVLLDKSAAGITQNVFECLKYIE